MSGLAAMWRKEWLELARTHRVTVCVALFVLLGLGSPSLAALTPDLLQALGGDDLGGFEILLTKAPDATDALLQYHKNFALTPVVVVLLGGGAVAGERARGTAELALVRPVSRAAFVLAKAAALAALLLACSLLSGFGAFAYTRALFGPVEPIGFVAVQALLSLQLLFYVAVALAASVLLRSALAASGVGLAVYVALTVAGSLPALASYTPAGLGNAALDLIVGDEPVRAAAPALVTAAAAVGLLGLAVAAFRRQEL